MRLHSRLRYWARSLYSGPAWPFFHSLLPLGQRAAACGALLVGAGLGAGATLFDAPGSLAAQCGNEDTEVEDPCCVKHTAYSSEPGRCPVPVPPPEPLSALFIDEMRAKRLLPQSEDIYTAPPGAGPDTVVPLYDRFPLLPALLFRHIDADYDMTGLLRRGEVQDSVAPGVFAQMGILEVDGVRCMGAMGVALVNAMRHGEGAGDVVFCDIGSGVGNVCLQLLTELPSVRSVVGVEVIRSRHEAAVQGYAWWKELFARAAPGRAHPAKTALFDHTSLIGSGPLLRQRGINVLFTHSWMFDDDLMDELARSANAASDHNGPLCCIITSRRFFEAEDSRRADAVDASLRAIVARYTATGPGTGDGGSFGDSTGDPNPYKKTTGVPLGPGWRLVGRTAFAADWSRSSPFYIYVRDPRPQGNPQL